MAGTSSGTARRRRWLAALAAGAAVGLAGCTGAQGGDSASSSGSSAGGAAAPVQGQPDGTADGTADGTGGGSSSGGSSSGGSSSGGQPAQARAELRTRALVVTVERTVRVRDLAAAARTAGAAARALGGRVDGEQAQTDPDTGRGTYAVVLRVPTGRVDELVRRVEGEGEVLARTRSVEDVTQQAQDVQARLAAARASADRVRALYRRTGSLRDLLEVEQALASRVADLESLERQSAGLADETSLATLRATFVTRAAPAVEHAGFVAGLGAGWRGLGRATVAVLTVAGAVLPFAPLALLAAAAAWVVRRRLRRRAGAGGPPAASLAG